MISLTIEETQKILLSIDTHIDALSDALKFIPDEETLLIEETELEIMEFDKLKANITDMLNTN